MHWPQRPVLIPFIASWTVIAIRLANHDHDAAMWIDLDTLHRLPGGHHGPHRAGQIALREPGTILTHATHSDVRRRRPSDPTVSRRRFSRSVYQPRECLTVKPLPAEPHTPTRH